MFALIASTDGGCSGVISTISSVVCIPINTSGANRRPKKAAARYFSISSGIVIHLLPVLVNQPSAFAISKDTVGPSKTSPVCLSVATALHLLESPTKRKVEKRPQELRLAIIKLDPQDGRPWIMCKFCITISGLAPIRFAISNATRVLATLFL